MKQKIYDILAIMFIATIILSILALIISIIYNIIMRGCPF